MRKFKRIIKIKGKDKAYFDTVSKLYIYELFSARDFGIASWIVAKDDHSKGLIQGTFICCKQFLYENFEDNAKPYNYFTFNPKIKS